MNSSSLQQSQSLCQPQNHQIYPVSQNHFKNNHSNLIIKIIFIILYITIIYLNIQNYFSNYLNVHQPSTIKLPQLAGQIHYSRIPQQYWEHRIKTIRSLGINTLSVYIMWNYHQISKSNFDFKSNGKNLTHFLQLAQKYSMKVWIRPGPYVCAQWDFGGFPGRLLSVQGIKLRQNNQIYLDQVKIYFQALAIVLKRFTIGNNPTITKLQIQNQFGTFYQDFQYIKALSLMWKQLGILTKQYSADALKYVQKTHIQNVDIGLNGGVSKQDYQEMKKKYPNNSIFGGQYYSGWLTHWRDQKWAKRDISATLNDVNMLLQNQYSFSLYMIHGGTNFGLTAGANKNEDSKFMPTITSYDYNAPINEQGSPSQDFLKYRQTIQKFYKKSNQSIPQMPQQIKTIQIQSIEMKIQAQILLNLKKTILNNVTQIPFFESNEIKMWNQGIIIYKSKIPKGKFIIQAQIRDFAILWINNKIIKLLDRSQEQIYQFQINCMQKEDNQIILLVQAMGHVNFSPQMLKDVKGLISFKVSTLFQKDQISLKWDLYPIHLNETSQLFSYENKKDDLIIGPTLLEGTFNLIQIGDSFIDMKDYGKGYIWINGHNLGRYWNVGPQKRLFCPGVWLQKGNNEIKVLQLLNISKIHNLHGKKTLKDD